MSEKLTNGMLIAGAATVIAILLAFTGMIDGETLKAWLPILFERAAEQ